MKIIYFDYSFHSHAIKFSDPVKSVAIPKGASDFVLEGGKVNLFWVVEGALSVRIYPKIGKVTGNSAEVIITKNNRNFILEARGLFSKKRVELTIPESKIKTLDTAIISKSEIFIKVDSVKSLQFSKHSTNNLKITRSPFINRRVKLMPQPMTRSLIYRLPEKFKWIQKQVSELIQKQRFVKSYSFSTRKYNSINQVKPFNLNDHE